MMLHPPLLVECCNRFLMAPRSDVHPASSAGFCIGERLATKPVFTGSPTATITIGILLLAAFAAKLAGVADGRKEIMTVFRCLRMNWCI